MTYNVVEKKHENYIHGVFCSKDAADRFLQHKIPTYVSRGYYMDKTLTADSFKVMKAIKE